MDIVHIIKHGNKKEKEQKPMFVCDNCGCEFDAEPDECWIDTSVTYTMYPSKWKYYTCCPECHKVCSCYKTSEVNVDNLKITL